VDSGGFLGTAQVTGCVEVVCMAKGLLHRRTGVLARVYVHLYSERGVPTNQVSWDPVYAGVHYPQLFLTSQYIYSTQSLQDVHTRLCMRISFIRVQGQGWGVLLWRVG